MEIQQASYYAAYIRRLGWQVERIGGGYIYIKPFPFIGGLAKIQRTKTLPQVSLLAPIISRFHIRTIAIEPDTSVNQSALRTWVRKVRRYARVNTDYFLPTKTLRVDVTPSEDTIFGKLSEAKRRAVRRAEKFGIRVRVTDDIDTFIRLKNTSAGFLGFITTAGVKKLWESIPRPKTAVLLAYAPGVSKPVAGIFLIFWNRLAYYWVAGATKQGKKSFAPSLLVWEALRISKARGCRALDFVGVWDDRQPEKNPEWKGFTKFKEGFGGSAVYYPLTPDP